MRRGKREEAEGALKINKKILTKVEGEKVKKQQVPQKIK
jgi:hypothetical protein